MQHFCQYFALSYSVSFGSKLCQFFQEKKGPLQPLFCRQTRFSQITVLSRHELTVSDFPILIKSCSIESRNYPNPKSEVVHETKFSLKITYSTNACLAQIDQHLTCKPVMVNVVSSTPTRGNFISFKTP